MFGILQYSHIYYLVSFRFFFVFSLIDLSAPFFALIFKFLILSLVFKNALHSVSSKDSIETIFTDMA